jgi:hypothetical protein
LTTVSVEQFNLRPWSGPLKPDIYGSIDQFDKSRVQQGERMQEFCEWTLPFSAPQLTAWQLAE